MSRDSVTKPSDLSQIRLHQYEWINGWRVVRSLAHTALSNVYLVRDPWGLVRVLKITRRSHDLYLPKFHEATVMRAYERCPDFPRLEEAWEDAESNLCLIMEYIRGVNLNRWILERGSWPLPQKLIVNIITKCLQCLSRLHACGIFHLDIKPGQFILNLGRLTLMDFGLAVFQAGQRWHTNYGVLVGTPGYIAPEQIFHGSDVLDHRYDLHAIGAIARWLVTGKNPANNPEWHRGLPRLRLTDHPYSPQLIGMINHATETEPEDRFQSAQAWLNELKNLL